jgi:hypothetical protein
VNIRKSSTNLYAAVIALTAIAAIAIWQFYLFATFRNPQGLVDVQGGTHHLWWAIGAGLIACLAGVFVFSVFFRYDENNEMHITS